MPTPRERRRAVDLAVFLGLAALLFYPIHRPYLHPDQDLVPTLPLVQLTRGSWRPLVLMYGSALPNLLHLFDRALFDVGRALGWWTEPGDLLVVWCRNPWIFRVPPRLIAMTAGVASLVAVRGLLALAIDRTSALVGPILLGTWLMFVREHHHGLYDAPAAGLAMLALWAAGVHVRTARLRPLVVAGLLAGLATSCKLNLAPTVLAVLAGAAVAPHDRRLRFAVCAGLAAFAGLVVTSPELVLETTEVASFLRTYASLQAQALAVGAGSGGNELAGAFVRGIGWPGLLTAFGGLVLALVVRERVLAPLLVFVVLYTLVLVRSPLVLSRYALPMAGPLAVLAAFGLSRVPTVVRAGVVAGLVAFGLPSCLQHLRLLATDDTRTEAAELVRAAWARGDRVLVAANPVLASYVGPDLPQVPRYRLPMPDAAAARLARDAPRCVAPLPTIDLTRGAAPLAQHAGALVITSDPPAPVFDKASTPPSAIAILEHDATLVADLAVEARPTAHAFEPFDLNYLPFSGLDALMRPGPRLRVWRVGDHATTQPAGR